MKNLNLYLLTGKENGILIDIVMSDDIKSHRYYYLDNNMDFYRIKSVDNLIEYLDHNDINTKKMNNEETYKLYGLLSNNSNNKKNVETKKDYPGLTEMTTFDNEIINKYFTKRLIKYYNKLTELYEKEKKVK